MVVLDSLPFLQAVMLPGATDPVTTGQAMMELLGTDLRPNREDPMRLARAQCAGG
jgi:hypothetical protein